MPDYGNSVNIMMIFKEETIKEVSVKEETIEEQEDFDPEMKEMDPQSFLKQGLLTDEALV